MDRHQRNHWVRVSAIIWCGLILGFAIFGFNYPWSHSVYDIYSSAGRAWWRGEDLYTCSGRDFFRYSPLFAIGISPLAQLPEHWGNALWRVLNCSLYAAGLFAWGRHVTANRRSQLAGLFLLVLPLSVHSMYNAQANLFMIGCLLLGLAAAMDQRWNQAGGWIALATLVKGYPVALALLIMAAYPRRFALRYIVALTVGLLLPFLAQRPETVWAQYVSWWHHLRDSTVILRERLRSLEHLLAIYGHPLSPQTFMIVQGLAALGILALCLLLAARSADVSSQLTWAFALYSIWVILFSPATEASTYVVVAPAVAWAILDAANRNSSWAVRVLLVVSMLLMGPVPSDLFGQTVRTFANGHGSQPIGALLFLACLLPRVARSMAADHTGVRILPQSQSVAA